jgi:hypothetical protein
MSARLPLLFPGRHRLLVETGACDFTGCGHWSDSPKRVPLRDLSVRLAPTCATITLLMAEYTVSVETAPGASSADEDVVAVHDALIEDPVALGPSAMCHIPTATISSTFQVEADSEDAATDIATAAFGRALAIAGVTGGWRVAEVSPSEDLP